MSVYLALPMPRLPDDIKGEWNADCNPSGPWQRDLGCPQPVQTARLSHLHQSNKQENVGSNGSCANIKSVAELKWVGSYFRQHVELC